MTRAPPITHIYPDTEPTSQCPILLLPSAWLGSDKYQFVQVICLTQPETKLPFSHTREVCALLIPPLRQLDENGH